MRKHFVIFYSPGTFVAESTQKGIDSWNVLKARRMAHGIKERHGATPYGFRFVTRERKSKDLDSREVKCSDMYYLGGKISTLKELKARHNPEDATLIRNMEMNNWDRCITNTNSWKWTMPLRAGDKVLSFKPRKKKIEGAR